MFQKPSVYPCTADAHFEGFFFKKKKKKDFWRLKQVKHGKQQQE